MLTYRRFALAAAALTAGGLLSAPAAVAAPAPAPAAHSPVDQAGSPLGQATRPAPDHYLGKPCDQGKTTAEADGYRTVRIVEQGQMLTQEHMPDRLNLHCDAEGLVEKANMG